MSGENLDPRADRLWLLLPAVHRERDAEQGYPLRSLLAAVAVQVGRVEADVEGLWNDLFIETCRPWAIPYLGGLVANRLLYEPGRTGGDETARQLFRDLAGVERDLLPESGIRTRADVAKTIYYRRRKATLPMLEELARDVTGWPTHAVEFFTRLGWHQHREHRRWGSQLFDPRKVDRCERVGGAFDAASYTVDLRPVADGEGRYQVPAIGFFLYRLGSYELERVPARRAGADWQFHASPLGNPMPLFTRTRREGDESGLSTELHVPAPIRRGLFYEDLVRYAESTPVRPDSTDLYGAPVPLPGIGLAPEASFFLARNGVPVAPSQNPAAPPGAFLPQIVCGRLDPWPAAQPTGRLIVVDVTNGRLAVGDGWGDATEGLDAWWHYGFPADLGGGPYDRRKWLIAPGVPARRLRVQEGVVAGPDLFPSVIDALQEWDLVLGRPDAVISILDSRTYALPATLSLPNEGSLVIEAANGERPLLITEAAGLELASLPPVDPADPDREAAFTLSGVVVEGHLHVTGDFGRLRLLHSTLVPGRRLLEDGEPATASPSLIVDGGGPGAPINTELVVELAFSISGALEIPAQAERLVILDSIVDGLEDASFAVSDGAGGAGPATQLERSTVVGRVSVARLEMSESIATGRVRATRTQDGCVRFSFVPPTSRTPRRYRCQSDLAIETLLAETRKLDPGLTPLEAQALRDFTVGRLVPTFTARRYGRPAYLQLAAGGPVELATGAEDGAEMGVYCHLKQPQRQGNLRLRLSEYLPLGLEAALILAT